MRLLYWDIIFSLLALGAIYIFIKTPMKKRWPVGDAADPILGFSLMLISIVYAYFAHFAINLVPASDYAPCGRLSRQAECYNLTQETCMVAWHSSMGDCDDQLAAIRQERPTALMGSFLETCIGRNFDKVMRYNRRNLELPSCQVYFNKMDEK